MSTVCYSVEFGLRMIGLWPGTSYANLRKFLCLLSMAIFQIFQYRYLFLHFGKDDLSLLMDVLSANLTYSLLFIKLIIFVSNARLLDEIVACVIEDWKERDVSDEHTMTKMAYVSRRYSNLIIASHAMSVWLYAIGTMLRHKNNNQTDARELLLKMELPFGIENPTIYITVLLTQFVHQTNAASIMGMLNSLLIILVLHACGQMDIMRQKLNEITRNNIERGEIGSIMKALTIRHQRIIAFSKNIETLFSNIALVQFVSNTLIICCLGFLIVISIGVPGGSTMLIKSVFFYIVINLEAFIFCFVGEYLSTKSKMIGDAAYESLWYDLTPTQNRDLLLMIVRSQKHLSLTVGKIMDLSLQQFTSVVKVSASYVSVLHAMY